MTTGQTTDRLRSVIASHLFVEVEKVTDDASFVDDLGADSLDGIELQMAIEEEFSIEITDDDADKFETVGDVVKYLGQRGVLTQ